VVQRRPPTCPPHSLTHQRLPNQPPNPPAPHRFFVTNDESHSHDPAACFFGEYDVRGWVEAENYMELDGAAAKRCPALDEAGTAIPPSLALLYARNPYGRQSKVVESDCTALVQASPTCSSSSAPGAPRATRASGTAAVLLRLRPRRPAVRLLVRPSERFDLCRLGAHQP
jgi:hypothetical protein